MGTAKINQHIGLGRYEITYFRDNTAIINSLIDFNKTLADIESKLPDAEADLQYYTNKLSEILSDLNVAIDVYSVCANTVASGQDPTKICSTEYNGILALQQEHADTKTESLPSLDNYNNLIASQLETNKLIALYESAPEKEEIREAWCADCCDRPEETAPTGEWYGHAAIIPDDTEVNTIEILDQYGKITILIAPSASAPPPPENCSSGVLNDNYAGANYNSVIIAGQETWKPSYRFAKILTMTKTESTVSVDYLGSKFEGVDLNSQLKSTDIPISYMGCGSGRYPFEVGDIVAIAFGGDPKNPKCIGYRNNPQPCIYVPECGFQFVTKSAEETNVYYYIKKDIEGVWRKYTGQKGGSATWYDTANQHFLSWQAHPSNGYYNYIDFASEHYSDNCRRVYYNGSALTPPSVDFHSYTLAACIDANGNLLVINMLAWKDPLNNNRTNEDIRFYKYNWTDWELIYSNFYIEGQSGESSSMRLASMFSPDGSEIYGRGLKESFWTVDLVTYDVVEKTLVSAVESSYESYLAGYIYINSGQSIACASVQSHQSSSIDIDSYFTIFADTRDGSILTEENKQIYKEEKSQTITKIKDTGNSDTDEYSITGYNKTTINYTGRLSGGLSRLDGTTQSGSGTFCKTPYWTETDIDAPCKGEIAYGGLYGSGPQDICNGYRDAKTGQMLYRDLDGNLLYAFSMPDASTEAGCIVDLYLAQEYIGAINGSSRILNGGAMTLEGDFCKIMNTFVYAEGYESYGCTAFSLRKFFLASEIDVYRGVNLMGYFAVP